MGTCDGRTFHTSFKKESFDNFSYQEGEVILSQKKPLQNYQRLIGSVNAVDYCRKDNNEICLIGGTQNLCPNNLKSKRIGLTIIESSKSIGATTAARFSPNLDFIAFATGTDWHKGIQELGGIKKPIVSVIRFG